MLPNQMFNAVLSSLRTFDPLSDTLDILIISFVFYQLLQFARKSRAGQLVKGIILILVFYGLAVMLNLKTVTWVLNNVITIGFMAAVVIFQPELQVETISTRLEPLPLMEFSNALRIAFLALRIAGTDCTDWRVT